MRVGILTFHSANNYGAVLQTLGLCNAIKELGHDPIVLDYRPASARKAYRKIGLRSRDVYATLLKRWRFHHFRQTYLPLSPTRYMKPQDFTSNPCCVDALVAGSDQVWNIRSYRGYDPTFFLSLGQSWAHVPRISYAASVGATESFEPYTDEIRGLLRPFDSISVRDCKSKQLIEQTTKCIAQLVLDPTFLASFDHYTVVPNRIPDNVLGVYTFENSPDFVRIARRVAKELSLKICAIGCKTPHADLKYNHAGPVEWLGCMRHSKFIITNSFHGVCFAVKYCKPFLVYPRKGGEQQRLTDFLTTLGMEYLITSRPKDTHSAINRAQNIDYASVAAAIEGRKNSSKAYLLAAIQSSAPSQIAI